LKGVAKIYILDNNLKKGKKLLIIITFVFIGFLVLDLITSSLYLYNVGYESLISQFFNIVIKLVIISYAFKGRKWARIFTGILLILNSLAFLTRITEAVISRIPIDLFIIYLVFGFITNLTAGIMLLRSHSIKSFMEFQANKA
jgi:hypothetical protein